MPETTELLNCESEKVRIFRYNTYGDDPNFMLLGKFRTKGLKISGNAILRRKLWNGNGPDNESNNKL